MAEQKRERRRMSRREEWFSDHRRYLATPAWRNKRDAVMRRAGGICESCGNAQAIQVHHVSYKYWGHEPLWDLKAVCRECHETLTAIDRGTRAARPDFNQDVLRAHEVTP